MTGTADPYRPFVGASARPAPRIRLASPDLGDEEIDAVARVLRSGILTNGPATAAFEAAFASRHDVRHAVAFGNGTVALASIYRCLDIGPGDEVIVPSLTFISTATSVLHVGALPVFADVDGATFNLDPADVVARVTARTKAIVAVHYGGQPADLAELRAVADEAGVNLIEDAAEAHGAAYQGRPVGGFGAAAMFSFTPTKNLTTGEGGMVTTDDDDLDRRLRLMRNHGQSAPYRHDTLGWNLRLTEMQAAIGTCQLAKLDAILARKAANATWLDDRLAAVEGVQPPARRPDRTHTHMLYTVIVDADRDAVMADLADAGIESRLYFPPAHHQAVFATSGIRPPDLPVTERVTAKMLSLPFHSRLGGAELEEIAGSVAGAVDRHRR